MGIGGLILKFNGFNPIKNVDYVIVNFLLTHRLCRIVDYPVDYGFAVLQTFHKHWSS